MCISRARDRIEAGHGSDQGTVQVTGGVGIVVSASGEKEKKRGWGTAAGLNCLPGVLSVRNPSDFASRPLLHVVIIQLAGVFFGKIPAGLIVFTAGAAIAQLRTDDGFARQAQIVLRIVPSAGSTYRGIRKFAHSIHRVVKMLLRVCS